MKKREKVVLIGANGLIGKAFIEKYRNKYQIIKCLRKHNTISLLKKHKPSIIFNSSGEPYNEKAMFYTNLILVKKILDYCIKNKCYFIHLGSSGEYGRHNYPTSENTFLKPATKYESTKAAASLLVSGYAKAYKLNAIVVRPYCVFGYFSKQNLLIPRIINSIKHNKEMKIFRGVHDFIYVKDFIRGISIIIDKKKIWKNGEIINLGSGIQLSNVQVLKKIQNIFGKKGKFTIINKKFRPYDTDCWVCDTRYAKKRFGFKTKYNFPKAMLDIFKYYKKKIKI
tara:strand:- start:290 stop:1135 length:846 start_codon:yes stop_codon:yes gene_type:complete